MKLIKSVSIKLIAKSNNTTIKFNSFCQEFYDSTSIFKIKKFSVWYKLCIGCGG